MKNSILTFLLLAGLSLHSQLPKFSWVRSVASGTLASTSVKICSDASGNIYTTGYFYGSIDADPGTPVVPLNSSGNSDVFISKFNSSGTFIWTQRIGGSGSDQSWDLEVDASGNVYCSGYFDGIMDLDPTAGTYTVNGGSAASGFMVKLSSIGAFVWGRALTGTGVSLLLGFDLDASNNIYATGRFNGTTDFDMSIPTYTLASTTSDNFFVLKMDAAGTFQWARNIGSSTGNEYGVSVKADAAGNNFTVGHFDGVNTDFDPGASTFTMSSAGANDIFILKLDANGNFAMAKRIGGTGSDYPSSVELDGSGNIITAGVFRSTNTDFDPGTSTFTLASNGQGDAYVSKLDASGNFLWVQRTGGIGDDRPNGLAIDATGDIYTTGFFAGTVDFDPGAATYTIASNGLLDIYMNRLSGSTGNFVWARAIGGISDDYGNSIEVNSANDVISCGRFFSGSNIDFDPGSGVSLLTSAGNDDAYLHKMTQCIIPSAPINTTPASNLSICEGLPANLTATGSGTLNWYNVPTGGSVILPGAAFTTPALTTGTYTYYVESSTTCTTSIIRTPITITVNPNPTVTAMSSDTTICIGQTATLTAGGANSYTWSTGPTTSVIAVSPTTTTTYYVLGNSSGCANNASINVNVSTCTGINELNNSVYTISLYPNPVKNSLHISSEMKIEKIIISNSLGQIIQNIPCNSSFITIDVKELPEGIYFITADIEGKNKNFKIIKE